MASAPSGSSYVYYELLTGTWGARPDRDGNDGLCNICNIASNIPVEQAECEYPIRIERYGLVRDSGGAGKFRGGMSVEREWTLLDGDAHLAIRSDRRDHPPYGLQGGGNGTPSNNILRHADSDEVLPTMISTRMKTRETIYHKQPGGGGHGNPLERVPAAVAWDVKNDKVSIEAARKQYGVVLDPRTLEVDEAATQTLRRETGTAVENIDLVITGGTIMDSTGGESVRGDVSIATDESPKTGTFPKPEGVPTLDANNLVVAARCIDIDSHPDFTLLSIRPQSVLPRRA